MTHSRNLMAGSVTLLLTALLAMTPGVVEASAPIDINTATPEELQTLPGVGAARARAIVEHREQHGPFVSVDALADVRGIGPAILGRVRDMITAGETISPSPDSVPVPAAASTSRSVEPRPAEDGDDARSEDGDEFDLDLTREETDSVPPPESPLQAPPAEERPRPSPVDQAPESARERGPAGQVNLNTAPEAELVVLPGIGPARARAIISHRETAGPFRNVEEITDVSGVGPATYRSLRGRVTVQVDVNTASEGDLRATGLSEQAAGGLVAWRERHGPIGSSDELREATGLDPDELHAFSRLLWFDRG